jgi:hypothetical protein
LENVKEGGRDLAVNLVRGINYKVGGIMFWFGGIPSKVGGIPNEFGGIQSAFGGLTTRSAFAQKNSAEVNNTPRNHKKILILTH